VSLLVGELMDGVTNLKRPIMEVTLRAKYTILARFQEIYLTCFPAQAANKSTIELDDSSSLFFAAESCSTGDFMTAYGHALDC
jgi:hypothetical protein